eukprot:CAMPEP_0194310514 /NCGR_PEP_ID=MMETSP0171-20130528/7465_1 /TAXON_ID=218684 /ORGANISM="Corethron pennatum, Strain L29A3" /LENGTH=179 /DNA_ID=CAMNT_0039064189 /DNA_START=205 /DNA_END=745 /DNA_ORIENTATION=+
MNRSPGSICARANTGQISRLHTLALGMVQFSVHTRPPATWRWRSGRRWPPRCRALSGGRSLALVACNSVVARAPKLPLVQRLHAEHRIVPHPGAGRGGVEELELVVELVVRRVCARRHLQDMDVLWDIAGASTSSRLATRICLADAQVTDAPPHVPTTTTDHSSTFALHPKTLFFVRIY